MKTCTSAWAKTPSSKPPTSRGNGGWIGRSFGPPMRHRFLAFLKRALLTPVLREHEGVPKRIIVILFPIALALASRAEDWPQWRGRGRDGVWHETGIQKKFPAEGLPVRWRAAVGYG